MARCRRRAADIDPRAFDFAAPSRHRGQYVSLLFTANVPDQRWAEQSYLGHFHTLDAWTFEAMRRAAHEPKALRVVTGSELVPASRHRNSEFHWDFGRRIGVFHMLGSTIGLGGGGIAALGLHRPETSTDFERPAADRLKVTLPHLRRVTSPHWVVLAEF